MIYLKKSHLKAALSHAADKDVRYYLNSVCLEFTASGDVHILATDGHRMFCGLIPGPSVAWTDKPVIGGFRILIPRDAVKSALKSGGARVDVLTLNAMPDGRYSLGDTIFSAIEGTFPDWRRIVPNVDIPESIGQYNYDYLADAAHALQDWYAPVKIAPRMRHWENTGLMQGLDCTAFVVIMPCRVCDKVTPFKPASYELERAAA